MQCDILDNNSSCSRGLIMREVAFVEVDGAFIESDNGTGSCTSDIIEEGCVLSEQSRRMGETNSATLISQVALKSHKVFEQEICRVLRINNCAISSMCRDTSDVGVAHLHLRISHVDQCFVHFKIANSTICNQ